MASSPLPLILLAGAAFFLMGRDSEDGEENGAGATGATGATGGNGGSTAGVDFGATGATGAAGTLDPAPAITQTPASGQDRSEGSVVIDGLGEYKWLVLGGQGPGQDKYIVSLWDPTLPGLSVVRDATGTTNRLWDTQADAEADAVEMTNLAVGSINVMGTVTFEGIQPGSNPMIFAPTAKGDAMVVIGIPPLGTGWRFESLMAPGSTEDPKDFIGLTAARMADSAVVKLVVLSKQGNLPASDLMVRAIPPSGTQADSLPLVLVEGTA